MTQNDFPQVYKHNHTPNGHVHLEYVSLRTSFFETFYKINCVTIHHSSRLLSKLGPKARTETRTKSPPKPKSPKIPNMPGPCQQYSQPRVPAPIMCGHRSRSRGRPCDNHRQTASKFGSGAAGEREGGREGGSRCNREPHSASPSSVFSAAAATLTSNFR